jgi:hypothetical protein
MSNDVEQLLEAARPTGSPGRESTLVARRFVLDTVARTTNEGRTSRLRLPHITRKRLGLAAAFAAAAITVPAYAIATALVDFSSAEPASTIVKKRFAELGEGAPIPEMDPRVLPLSTRKAAEFHLPTGTYVLWVAPTAGGGFCDEFTGLGGGCIATRDTPTGIPPLAGSEVNPWLLDLTVRQRISAPPAPELLGGSVLARGTEQLELSFQDGARIDLPVTWVSPPIDAGFFLYAVPQEHQSEGHLPTVLVARASDGKLLARTVEQLAVHSVAHKPGT